MSASHARAKKPGPPGPPRPMLENTVLKAVRTNQATSDRLDRDRFVAGIFYRRIARSIGGDRPIDRLANHLLECRTALV
jgi:hypothetical protein